MTMTKHTPLSNETAEWVAVLLGASLSLAVRDVAPLRESATTMCGYSGSPPGLAPRWETSSSRTLSLSCRTKKDSTGFLLATHNKPKKWKPPRSNQSFLIALPYL